MHLIVQRKNAHVLHGIRVPGVNTEAATHGSGAHSIFVRQKREGQNLNVHGNVQEIDGLCIVSFFAVRSTQCDAVIDGVLIVDLQ